MVGQILSILHINGDLIDIHLYITGLSGPSRPLLPPPSRPSRHGPRKCRVMFNLASHPRRSCALLRRQILKKWRRDKNGWWVGGGGGARPNTSMAEKELETKKGPTHSPLQQGKMTYNILISCCSISALPCK
jgi:hypothetical protein